jgi:FAD/FMN-containing dehydrogenase
MTILVNDVHSRLNATEVREIAVPVTREEVQRFVRDGRARGLPIAVSGARHAMGGQQFRTGGLLLDLREMKRVFQLDDQLGLLHIEAGAQWPDVIRATAASRWGIRQKQTGADDVTLGGSIACNAHGRGLLMGPLVDDIESVTLCDANGDLHTCSRDENSELFSLVVGGYGLFGVVVDATLRLTPRLKMRRLVDIIDVDDALHAVRRRVAEGCLYGDFQYAIDAADDSFLRRGVFACYRPAPADTPVDDESADLSRESWLSLLKLAHTDKRRAFQVYAEHYLATHGRVYWSDTMQLGTYIPSYAEFLTKALGQETPESLMITELYVPPDRIIEFMAAARQVLRSTGVEDIYGTIRTIQRDSTSFLAWAREDFACVIFNLRTSHDSSGRERTAIAARGLIDAATYVGGSFYLTYHRWATREQILRSYPRMLEFLALKRQYDPAEIFQSDWYVHHLTLLQ